MKNGLDRKSGEEPEDRSNVVSFRDARARAAEKARDRARKGIGKGGSDDGAPRITLAQWIVGGLFMLLAIGGAIALVKPFVKGAGIAIGVGMG
jgi:hypothetical protein